MRRRLVLMTLLFASCIACSPTHSSLTQALEDAPPPVLESPPPSSEPSPASEISEEHRLPELLPQEPEDAVTALSKLRAAVRLSPDRADSRLKLAGELYRIGDLDAAIDECRAAIALESNNAKAHMQLGITLMAKQEGRNAARALKEAILLDPDTHTRALQFGQRPVLARPAHRGDPILSPSVGAATALSRRPLSPCADLEADESTSRSHTIDGGCRNRRDSPGAVLHGKRLS